MHVRIVIPYFKKEEFVTGCIRSIIDQDYDDYDAVIVLDGPDKKAEKLIKELVTDKFEIIVLDKNAGASHARNVGARYQGSYDALFFMDADCEFAPGMLREMVHQLTNGKDLAFVYGNYRVANGKYPGFESQPFDPYLLETMNYIPTMALVLVEAFEAVDGFNENLTYFQDWDLWYRIAKAGYIGKFINEFIFSTAPVDEESISGKPGLSLADKASNFRKDHKIKDKKLVVTTLGAPVQAIQRAKMLGADYVGPALKGNRVVMPVNYQFDNWEATYMVGVFNESPAALQNHFYATWKKPIYHFIGTDVFHLMNNNSVSMLLNIAESFKRQNATVFANSARLVKEMELCHIPAELLYTPIHQIEKYTPKELPNEFVVGVYYSDTNPMHSLPGSNAYQRSLAMNTSNMKMIMDVAWSMPDVKFKFFGGDRVGVEYNIEYCGRIEEDDMVDFINTCSVNLRSTVHDGFPQLPIQFNLCGRRALVSCPDKELLYCDKLSFEDVKNYEDNKSEIINKLYEMSTSRHDVFNHSKASHDYYGDMMSEEKFRKRIYEVIA